MLESAAGVVGRRERERERETMFESASCIESLIGIVCQEAIQQISAGTKHVQ